MFIEIPRRFKNATFENYKCFSEEQKKLVSLLQSVTPETLTHNIIILGNCGVGKTHLCYSFIKKNSEKHGTDCFSGLKTNGIEYRTIKQIIDAIRDCWSANATRYDYEVVERIKKSKVLIIDEVGVQYGSSSERNELYEIFNYRYENELPTIVCSNNTLDEIRDEYLGKRIFDRLQGGAAIFEFRGKSMRGMA